MAEQGGSLANRKLAELVGSNRGVAAEIARTVRVHRQRISEWCSSRAPRTLTIRNRFVRYGIEPMDWERP